jgi:hypothetical protein
MPSLGWRGTFLIIGSLGFVWVTVWIALVRGKRSGMLARQKPATGGERATTGGWSQLSPAAGMAFAGVAIAVVGACSMARWYGLAAVWVAIALAMLGPLAIAGFLPRQAFGELGWTTSLHEIARLRRFWILAVVSISINICWHFLVNWIPTYLRDDRGLGRSASGYLTSATFLAADLGNLGGGALALGLAAMGAAVVRARLAVMSVCVILVLIGTGLAMPQRDFSAIVLLCLMAAGTAAFMANYFSFTQEVSPKHTGLVAGYLGGLGNLTVAAYQPFAGAIRDWTGSLIVNFVIVGVAPLVGLTVLILGWNGKQHDGQNRPENGT